MRLTDAEIISLLNLHATDLVDLACDVSMGSADRASMAVIIERLRELTAMLSSGDVEDDNEVRTVQ